MNKKLLMVILVLVASMIVVTVAPALAKKFKEPEGVVVNYYSAGIAVIEDTPIIGDIRDLRITAFDFIDSTYGPNRLAIRIDMWFVPPGGTDPDDGVFMPIATFGTNSEAVADTMKVWTGLPASWNGIVVGEDEIMVDRHGNRITASLKEQIIWLLPGPYSVTIPAFTMALNKVGSSFHTETTSVLTGYPGASGWTVEKETMGFNGIGAFTCTDWDFDEAEMTDCLIIMHGKMTMIPPP